MSKLNIIEDSNLVEKLFASADSEHFTAWNTHPLFGVFGRALYKAVNDETGSHTPHYFAVMDENEPLILVPATSNFENVSSFGLPLTLGLRKGGSPRLWKKAFAAAFDHLRYIARHNNAPRIKILGGHSNSPLSLTDIACIDQRARPNTHIHAIVEDVTNEVGVRRQLRDSYRSLVNWGQRQIRPVYVNATDPSRANFDAYRDFHAKVTGSISHGSAYWDIFWQEIIAGHGELSLGFLNDGRLATGTLVIDAEETTYYASGVYDRELFDKPLGHFPVFDSIVRSKSRGLKTYDLGEIFPAGGSSEKEGQIGFFKKGFTSSFRLHTTWTTDV